MIRGAIILCGGQSTRMGSDKAWLPFGPGEAMLQRVARRVGEVIEPRRTIVVAAAGQELPQLPSGARIVRDRYPERGPMEGLAVGLRALVNNVDAAFVTSCDVPLLRAAFVERLFGLLDDGPAKNLSHHAFSAPAAPSSQGAVAGSKTQTEAVVPKQDAFFHPLSAVYRMSLLPAVEKLLAEDRLRLRFLFETCRTREVPIEDLRHVDPELDSLANCNRPEEYAAALRRCGFDPPTSATPMDT